MNTDKERLNYLCDPAQTVANITLPDDVVKSRVFKDTREVIDAVMEKYPIEEDDQ